MAPDLVLESLGRLGGKCRILDPMAGSGVVLRHAIELGNHAVGFDLDPLAVLMARVWTNPVSVANVERWTNRVVREARATRADTVVLDWMDGDEETCSFVEYWFGDRQRADLRSLAFVLDQHRRAQCREEDASALDVIRLALSRIIVTKEPRASLARDTSHSRPHKVIVASDFEVLPAFERSVSYICKKDAGTLTTGWFRQGRVGRCTEAGHDRGRRN